LQELRRQAELRPRRGGDVLSALRLQAPWSVWKILALVAAILAIVGAVVAFEVVQKSSDSHAASPPAGSHERAAMGCKARADEMA
jgi:hypothetical protein